MKHPMDVKTTLRKDRYNKKIEKFYVVVEEGDEELSDLEEVETHQESQALDILFFVANQCSMFYRSYFIYKPSSPKSFRRLGRQSSSS